VIDARLGREDHSLRSVVTMIGRRLKKLKVRVKKIKLNGIWD
jgi:hypothetical protein